MNVHDALDQIAEIRQRMAESLTFRGYRASTTAMTALLAVAAGFAQSLVDAPGTFRIEHYLAVWLTAALLGLGLVAGSFVLRRRNAGPIETSLTLAAIESFLPSVVVGVLVTYAVAYHHLTPEKFAMLPGLWMILFSLGVFASRRILPRAVFVAAGFYLLAGLYALTLDVAAALSPWTMASVFGVGQLLSAAILYVTLERTAPEVCVE